ncbi:hypothetical protein [Yersinia pseudotuberculosis]|uniref:hypothetical protein n=1 Tax=Yersinia pseudotuberculosis TaxID=633 RepID=UPI000ABC9206|nr:hypothetical protein [Yersinia pseudotuberculosis]
MLDLNLDQYFTPPEVANELIQTVIELLSPSGEQLFVEPSVGDWSFSLPLGVSGQY